MASELPVQTYARTAAVLFLISILAGAFGEAYVPSKLIVSADAAATAANLRASETLFRVGFAGYLIEAMCDIALTLVFYVLLRPVSHAASLLAAFFGLVSTATFAGAELFYFASSLVLRDAAYLDSFSADQRSTLALLAVKTYGLGGGVFMVFYGSATAIRGYLMFRSRYLPKFLGVLFVLAGAGFVIRSFVLVLAPAYATPLLLLPMVVAGVSLTVWLFTKGVDIAEWNARTSS